MPHSTFSDPQSQLLFILNKKDSANGWIHGLKIKKTQNGFEIGFIHELFKEWFFSCAKNLFDEAMSEAFPGENYYFTINYSIGLSRDNRKLSKSSSSFNSKSKKTILDNPDELTKFIPGEKNKLVIKLLENLANNKNPSCFTILLHGRSGVGKSTLLNQFAQELEKKGKKIYLSSARDFCLQIQNISCSQYARQFWKINDGLFLDDLQNLANHNIFNGSLVACIDHINSLQTGEKIIVLVHSSDKASRLDDFQPRLRQRIAAMYWSEIHEADLDVRIKYVEKQNQGRKLGLAKGQILSLCRNNTDISSLKGILTKIEFLKSLPADMATTSELNKLAGKKQDKSIQWIRIVERVALELKLETGNILSNSRKPDYVFARQISMYLCRELLGLSFNELGSLFGGKDHSTIMYGIKKIQLLKETDKLTHNILQKLENENFLKD